MAKLTVSRYLLTFILGRGPGEPLPFDIALMFFAWEIYIYMENIYLYRKYISIWEIYIYMGNIYSYGKDTRGGRDKTGLHPITSACQVP